MMRRSRRVMIKEWYIWKWFEWKEFFIFIFIFYL